MKLHKILTENGTGNLYGCFKDNSGLAAIISWGPGKNSKSELGYKKDFVLEVKFSLGENFLGSYLVYPVEISERKDPKDSYSHTWNGIIFLSKDGEIEKNPRKFSQHNYIWIKFFPEYDNCGKFFADLRDKKSTHFF